MTKQHSSSMYVGLLLSISTLSLSLFSPLQLQEGSPLHESEFLIVSLLLDIVAVRESTISMQLKSVVYVSKHRFREFTKQTWTSLLIDFVTFILCDTNCNTKIAFFWGWDTKWLHKGMSQVRASVFLETPDIF